MATNFPPRVSRDYDRLPSEFLSIPEAAEYTNTSIALWRKLVAQRRVRVTRIGRLVRIRKGDLEAFLSGE